MSISHYLRITIVLLAFFITTQSAHAMIGNEAVDNSTSDGWSNFVLALQTEVFTEDATVTEWEVYSKTGGTLGLLLLRDLGNSNYEVVGADFETANAGLNSFSFTPDAGVAEVLAGDILGLYIGTSKVAYGSDGADTVRWCVANGCIVNADTQLSAGEKVLLSDGGNRTYSINVKTKPGASLWITLIFTALGLGIIAFAIFKFRQVTKD
jgi:hypothetical protein